ncbi:HAD hydrolase-like protein [Gordonia sp. zg691]|uniref:HAD hydrolase-like protein n=1 Tax=Gordonia jinghuaiqii TaxID=2758710 RepID=A0A7D7LPN3_9ACTN|nr:HAD hydrolase-like protein [Gordonia jinghuaiqii]MBD0860008.1 HAD hydrolase-like protein [Gordonia jinghuaiqii]MCR5977174.1 HAD hydrolase-like protein [Gordonia jinghuaiqii]QMT00225.1 HAD hydrolase-like protein [Gordonia jinghuaiqii]
MTPPDPRHPETVLLVDLDGTVTDSFDGIANSFRHALAAVGAPEPDPDVVAGIVGPPMIDTLNALGLPPEAAEQAMRAYRERYTDIGWRENSVYDGMAAVLADLAASGRTVAIATSKNQTTARKILDHFGLTEHFRYIAGASDDGTRRHKSDVIAHAIAELGLPVDPDTGHVTVPVVMIGDRSHDVHGAAAFGISAILVRWGYSLDGEDRDAAWAVDSVAELRDVLGV